MTVRRISCAGTRITVESILERLAAGESFDQLTGANPRLSREAILAALDFAARAFRSDVVYPVTDWTAPLGLADD